MSNDDDSKEVYVKLGEKLRAAREKARLTQAEVAASAGMNASYYAQMERGEINPSLDKINRVSKVLRIRSITIL